MRISDWSSDVCSSDLEELRAEAFELVRTDRRGDFRPCRGEVGLNEGIAEAAHGEAGRCIVMPQPAAVAQHADSGPKSVCLSAQGAELRGGMILVPIGRASCRERVGQSVSLSGVAVSLNKKNKRREKN